MQSGVTIMEHDAIANIYNYFNIYFIFVTISHYKLVKYKTNLVSTGLIYTKVKHSCYKNPEL